MKLPVAALLFVSSLALAGCVGDTPDDTGAAEPADTVTEYLAGPPLWNDPQNAPHKLYGWPTLSTPPIAGAPEWWQPINGTALPGTITGIEALAAAPEGVKVGAGIAMFGSLLYVPGYGGESYVVDVHEPSAPKLLATMPTPTAERGAAMIAYPDGRLMAVVAAGQGFHVVNITDPTRPELINYTVAPLGGHKLGVVPGTPIVYNAASCGGHCSNGVQYLVGGPGQVSPMFADGKTEIYDLTDPEKPVLVQEFANGYACHHIFFWNDPAQDKHRALCAGLEYTQIWDTADPKDPKVLVNVPVITGIANTPSPRASIVAFSHYAGMSADGTVLIVGDEMGGGGPPLGCTVGPAGAVAGPAAPTGAVWFYDITVETDPRLKGWFSPGMLAGGAMSTCTAHHGRLVPAEGRDMLALAFYQQGVVVIDFTDPADPEMVGHFNDGTHTWEVWYNNGYLFTGDEARGTDVLRFT